MAFLFPFPRDYPSLFGRRLARDLLLLGLATQREGDRLLVFRSLDHKPPGPGERRVNHVNKEADHKAQRNMEKHTHTHTHKKNKNKPTTTTKITIFGPTLMKNILTSLGISQFRITFSLFLKASLAAENEISFTSKLNSFSNE